MNERMKSIYVKLYENGSLCTKEALAKDYGVTIKTIENTLKVHAEEISYYKELKRYRFNSLLPKYIPYKVFYNIFQNTINKDFRKDFLTIDNLLSLNNDTLMIETEKLSHLSKKIIMFSIAINDNCILEIEYTGTAKSKEIKYIRPRTLLSNEFEYFCYGTYDLLNKEKVEEKRTFKFKRMGNIKAIKYVPNEIFKENVKGDIYGEYKKDKYITLVFNKTSGDFFNTTNIFDNAEYEVVIGLNTNNVIVKMYYRNLNIEVVKLIQQWMPNIKIHQDDPLKEKIENIIKENFKKLIAVNHY